MTNTVRRIRVCDFDAVEAGEAMQVRLDGLPPIAVFRVGDEYFCTQDACTHAGASLGDEGTLEGHIVECSWHEGRFDVRTGAVCAAPPDCGLKTYPVSVDDGVVYIIEAEDAPAR